MSRQFLALLVLLAQLQTSPLPVHALEMHPDALERTLPPAGIRPLAPLLRADLQGDGILERISLADDAAIIVSEEGPVWESPAEWRVLQAMFTDLDGNGLPEATLLVWRPFQPWPVDRWLPYGGRIADFHDRAGESCHIILIGWQSGRYQERWAGSALADPVRSFTAADLDGDGRQELITLEGKYDDPRNAPGRAIKVWEWNGFGFSLVSGMEGRFTKLVPVLAGDGRVLILVP